MRLMNVDPAKTSIGWIGTGVMGQSMCSRLIDNGFALSVYSRTKEKADVLLDKGAKWSNSPKKLAERCDIVFTMVGFPDDVREVYFGNDGLLSLHKPGQVLVDMTTSEPSLAKDIYTAAKQQGRHSVDAPVSGGDVGARNGTLSVMVGGDAPVIDALRPIWDVLAKTIVHQGVAGSGQHAKMVNQILIATNMIGVCEALLYAHKAGLELNTVLASVSSGAAGSWSLSNLGPRIVKNNFEPGFFVEHFIKDMGIALDEANRMGLCLPGLALSKQLYEGLRAQGHGRDGTQALQITLGRLSGIDWSTR